MCRLCLRAIVYRDATIDLIIGRPSIIYYNLLPLLQLHANKVTCCGICSTGDPYTTPVALNTDLTSVNVNAPTTIPKPFVINVSPNVMEFDFITDFRQSWDPQHMSYSGQKATLFHNHRHMSELLQHDDDAIDTERPNDISPMVLVAKLTTTLRLGDLLNFNNEYETYSKKTTTFLALI